jgi:[ribosomal protein S5]-alanine N-acetyltransferase
VPELQFLRADHAPAVLAFELANRAYFAAFISDRGDEFFEEFTDRHNALLAEQEAGVGAYYVLVAEDGSVLGRFNLYRVQDGTAELGYRVAQHVAGRGVATGTVGELCGLAAARHGLRTIRAATNSQNEASQRVLIKNGFVATGPADPGDIGGKPGTWYQRDLSAGPDRRDPARALAGRPGGSTSRRPSSTARSMLARRLVQVSINALGWPASPCARNSAQARTDSRLHCTLVCCGLNLATSAAAPQRSQATGVNPASLSSARGGCPLAGGPVTWPRRGSGRPGSPRPRRPTRKPRAWCPPRTRSARPCTA